MNKLLKCIFVLLALFQIWLYPDAVMGQQSFPHLSATAGRLTLSFNEQTRTFELYDMNAGLLLSAGIINTEINGKLFSTNDPKIKYEKRTSNEGTLTLRFNGEFVVKAELTGDSVLTFYADGMSSKSIGFSARAPLSGRTMGAILGNEKDRDNKTIVQTMGVGDVPGLKSIFDPMKDIALQIESDGKVSWNFFHQWQLKANAESGQALCRIKLIRNYYRDRLGISYYAPIEKRSYFQKAPALAMTWVGIEGKYNRPDFSQRKEWLYPNIDWVSKNLLPYAEEMVFQLDDNYPIDKPQYMRDISDYIRSRGLIPGIWMAPFGVAPYKESELHPEWFIHNEDGSIITTFSGLSYDDIKHYNSAVLNVNNKEAVNKWFAGFLNQVNKKWNYDYYKMDGIPAIFNVYKKSVDGGGVEGVRRGLQIIRSVIGPDKYINTSWGFPLDGIDIVNGSRVGGDTEQENQVISSVAVAQNYLNNVALYSDPDGAANMYASTTARARLNFQGRALLGQPYVTDDNWTKVPDNILYVWQRTLPVIESFPINLYPIADNQLYDHFDLKIKKPWGEWDVVGLNNYENKSRQMTLDLERLPLEEGEFYVYDFWNQKYLGKHAAKAKITRNMEALDAHCFNLVPVQDDQPVLISTSRHFTQGGVDLHDVKQWKSDETNAWYYHGKSNHLIKNDPYDLVFVCNGYDLTKAITVEGGSAEVLYDNSIIRVRIIPDGQEVEWKLTFVSENKTSPGFGAEAIHIIPGQSAEVPINSITPQGFKWKVRSSDKNIRIKEDYSRSRITIEVDENAVGWEETLSGILTLYSKKNDMPTSTMLVEVQGPDRNNIALQAKATASSVYFQGDQNGYGRPVGANDGRTFRAWEAAEGETSGWLELTWEKPVTFQRLVIDEWLESGGEIQSWELEAEGVGIIKKGGSIGRGFVINLDEPITTKVLRFKILKSSKRPGVWEIELN